jgi:hypothetical protein
MIIDLSQSMPFQASHTMLAVVIHKPKCCSNEYPQCFDCKLHTLQKLFPFFISWGLSVNNFVVCSINHPTNSGLICTNKVVSCSITVGVRV